MRFFGGPAYASAPTRAARRLRCPPLPSSRYRPADPSRRAASWIFCLVAGARCRARGALFRTIETVAGEKPLVCATSRIVTVIPLLLVRFTPPSRWPASSGTFGSDCNGGLMTGGPFLIRPAFQMTAAHGTSGSSRFQMQRLLPSRWRQRLWLGYSGSIIAYHIRQTRRSEE